MTHMWSQLGWKEIFFEAQQSGDRQTQLALMDNTHSIVRAIDLPDKTLEDLVLMFAYLLVICACSSLTA